MSVQGTGKAYYKVGDKLRESQQRTRARAAPKNVHFQQHTSLNLSEFVGQVEWHDKQASRAKKILVLTLVIGKLICNCEVKTKNRSSTMIIRKSTPYKVHTLFI